MIKTKSFYFIWTKLNIIWTLIKPYYFMRRKKNRYFRNLFFHIYFVFCFCFLLFISFSQIPRNVRTILKNDLSNVTTKSNLLPETIRDVRLMIRVNFLYLILVTDNNKKTKINEKKKTYDCKTNIFLYFIHFVSTLITWHINNQNVSFNIRYVHVVIVRRWNICWWILFELKYVFLFITINYYKTPDNIII